MKKNIQKLILTGIITSLTNSVLPPDILNQEM